MNVVAVVVTYNRCELLKKCLESLESQIYQLDKIIVIDNFSCDSTLEFLYKIDNEIIDVVELKENVGGAGGFEAGLKYALKKYPESYYWLMDDDGYPENDCLDKLVDGLTKYNLEAIAPLQINIHDKEKLSFPIPFGSLDKIVNVGDLPKKDYIPQAANLFNGLLINKKTIDEIGLPRKELFIRGDEVDFTKRMYNNLIRFGMLLTAKFYHPSDMNERIPLLFGKIITRDAHSDFKNYYLFRNRALSFKEDKKKHLIYLDFIRYTFYFLIKKRFDVKGWGLWCKATYDGIKGCLGRHPNY